MERQKKRRIWLLCAAGTLLVIALIWNIALSNNGRLGKLTRYLQGFGYALTSDDLYIAGTAYDSTIADLLSDMPLETAVAASKSVGLNSDINKTGRVELVLAALSNEDVITLFLVDAELELGFVQTPEGGGVYALGED